MGTQTTTVTPVDVSKVPVAVARPQNATATLLVRRDGVVAALRVSYETSYLDASIGVTPGHWLVDVGETSAERPKWVDREGMR